MDKQAIRELAVDFIRQSQGNVISEQSAISAEMAGLRLFEEPTLGFASAGDPLFTRMKDLDVVGPHFIAPDNWVPGARSVISFFLPFSEPVRSGNASIDKWPSAEWLHARFEGQMLVTSLATHLCESLSAAGYLSVVPSSDQRFFSRGKASVDEIPVFTSNWSERHVAFVCGLGTFSLSKGLITERGVAGRFGSIVTTLDLPPDSRAYSDPYQYCSFCGDCITNCPVGAITLETGKDHLICSDFLDVVKEKFSPRYGCGKCQVGVSCEAGIPKQQ
jgi:epoxyqueuosine reductase